MAIGSDRRKKLRGYLRWYLILPDHLVGVYLVDHPQITGSASIPIVFSEMIKLFILPDSLQVSVKQVTHFHLWQKATGSNVTFSAHIGIVECFKTVFPRLVKLFS